MFARPQQKNKTTKKTPFTSKHISPTAKTQKKPMFSSPLIKQFSPQRKSYHQLTINKIASIKTLPPLALQNSDSTFSNNKSVDCSQNNSETWKDDELFYVQNKESIAKIDQRLMDVVETIKKQRNIIDCKIWKLRDKLLENRAKIEEGKREKEGIDACIQAAEEMMKESLLQYDDKITQYPEQTSQYYKMQVRRLGILNENREQENRNIVSDQISDDIKIEENKMIIELLLNKFV